MSPHRSQVTFAIGGGIFAALLLLGVLWLLLPSRPLFAQNLPNDLGSIHGVIRDSDGKPLPNINVSIYDATIGGFLRQVATDVQGRYEFLSVPPGSYLIRAQDDGRIYASKYYVNSILFDDATKIVVSGHDVPGIDMKLELGGTISVTIETSVPISTSSGQLYLFAKSSTGYWRLYDTLFWSLPDSQPVFYGVPSGSYEVCAEPSFYPSISEISECYDNAIFIDSALPFLGVDIPPVDATPIVVKGAAKKTIVLKFGDLSQLQGVVQTPTGKPLPDVTLTLQDSATANRILATSGADGRFKYSLILEGNYFLEAIAPFNRYLPTFYNGTTETPQAEPFKITSTSRLSVTVTLPPSGSIIGSIHLQGGGIPSYPTFQIYQPVAPDNHWEESNQCSPDVCATDFNPESGVYTVTGLTTGKYRIQAAQYLGPQDSVPSFYGGRDFQNAADVGVTTGKATSNINITLGAGDFDGAISGADLANGAPAAGIDVNLFYYGLYGGLPYTPPFITTTTDNLGQYRFDGLASGPYAVGFRDPKGKYAINFYGSNYLTPTAVIITGSMTISGINVSLSTGGSIVGKIVRAQDKNPADFDVHALIADGGFGVPFLDSHSDKNGNYAVTGLPPGRYLVLAASPLYNPDFVFSQYYPFGNDSLQAQVVEVAPGEVRKGIDIHVDVTPSAFLPQINDQRGQAEEAPIK